MINIKVIKTEADYEEALEMIEGLMRMNPSADSLEADQLHLLSTLIKDYESNQFPESLPDPVEAIKFRMEQANLSPADLVDYIGSRSKVSEVLSGKLPLTLKMIRALESNLGIPANVLIQDTKSQNILDLRKEVVDEIISRGYLDKIQVAKEDVTKCLESFFKPLTMSGSVPAMLRQTNYRTAPATDRQALFAWFGCVMNKVENIEVATKYKAGTVTLDFMRDLAKLSAKENAPVLVCKELLKNGIVLVVEPHFARTRLDGAAIMINKEKPVIGLTLRFDRLDNFWFTLMHELAHLSLHHSNDTDLFFDELKEVKGILLNEMETEADALASEALVPSEKWEVSAAKIVPSVLAANSLAKELGIHVAIVAGKMRYESGFEKLTKIVTDATVQDYFPEVNFK